MSLASKILLLNALLWLTLGVLMLRDLSSDDYTIEQVEKHSRLIDRSTSDTAQRSYALIRELYE